MIQHWINCVFLPRLCLTRLHLTLGAGGVCRVGDVAGQTDVERAAEASVLLGRGGELQYALHVVELSTHRDHAAPDVLAWFLAHKTCVYALEREEINEPFSVQVCTVCAYL